MLLWISNFPADYLGRVLQGREDLASNLAFEAAGDLSLAHSLCGAATHVDLGSWVVPESDDNDAMESSVGLAVAAAVETMPVGLA